MIHDSNECRISHCDRAKRVKGLCDRCYQRLNVLGWNEKELEKGERDKQRKKQKKQRDHSKYYRIVRRHIIEAYFKQNKERSENSKERRPVNATDTEGYIDWVNNLTEIELIRKFPKYFDVVYEYSDE